MKILLADDQINLYATLHEWLEREPGFEVIDGGHHATQLKQKLADIERRLDEAPEAAPDLLLMDLELPGLQAKDARREFFYYMHKRFPMMHIVIMGTEPKQPKLPADFHVAGYFSKSEAPSLLLALLRTFQNPFEISLSH